MQSLSEIPFELDVQPFMQKLRIEPDSEDAESFIELVERAKAEGKPKAVFRETYLEARSDDTVTIDGVKFKSRMLRKNLDKAQRVFPYVATCGAELDQVSPPNDDFLRFFWWDTLKTTILRFARNYLNDYLKRKYRLGKTATMSPGSGDVSVWPIEQQGQLFTLLGNVTEKIGVRLTDSYLMVPNKSVSGILYPTEKDFRSCQVCRREKCPGRSAPFDKDMWDLIQH